MTYQVLDPEDYYDGYGDDPWNDEDEESCAECDRPALDGCQCCGAPLCAMHSEIGCGFCKSCPTVEWIEEQEETRAADALTEADSPRAVGHEGSR